jgi:hypothetical protein
VAGSDGAGRRGSGAAHRVAGPGGVGTGDEELLGAAELSRGGAQLLRQLAQDLVARRSGRQRGTAAGSARRSCWMVGGGVWSQRTL